MPETAQPHGDITEANPPSQEHGNGGSPPAETSKSVRPDPNMVFYEEQAEAGLGGPAFEKTAKGGSRSKWEDEQPQGRGQQSRGPNGSSPEAVAKPLPAAESAERIVEPAAPAEIQQEIPTPVAEALPQPAVTAAPEHEDETPITVQPYVINLAQQLKAETTQISYISGPFGRTLQQLGVTPAEIEAANKSRDFSAVSARLKQAYDDDRLVATTEPEAAEQVVEAPAAPTMPPPVEPVSPEPATTAETASEPAAISGTAPTAAAEETPLVETPAPAPESTVEPAATPASEQPPSEASPPQPQSKGPGWLQKLGRLVNPKYTNEEVSGKTANTGQPPGPPPPPTAEAAPPGPEEQPAAPAPTPEPPKGPEPTPAPATPPTPEKTLNNKVKEREDQKYSKLGTEEGQVREFKIGGHTYTIKQRVVTTDNGERKDWWVTTNEKGREVPPFPERVVRDALRKEARAEIRGEADAAKKETEKAARTKRENQRQEEKEVKVKAEADRKETVRKAAEDRKKAAAEEATRKQEADEAAKAEKAKQTEALNQRVQQLREALQPNDKLKDGKKALTYVGRDKDYGYYKFTDETGNAVVKSEADVNKLLGEKIKAEAKKTTPEQEKPVPTKWRERLAAAGALAESAGTAIRKGAEATPITRGLYHYVNRFLNKFDLRDKELSWYVAGVAVGAATNVGLTFITGGTGLFAGRIVRSALFSGVAASVSYGANLFRHGRVEGILKNFGVTAAQERKSYSRQFDEAFRLLRGGHEERYHTAMSEIAKNLFAKHGRPELRLDLESQLAQEARTDLLRRVEALNTKYQKLNNAIRSFSAGLTAGSIGSTLGFAAFEKIFEPAFNRIFGAGEVHPGAVPGGVEHPTPTPTPIPTPGPSEAPGGVIGPDVLGPPAPEVPPEIPDLGEILSNPDLTQEIKINPGDTVGQIFVNSGQEVTWTPADADLFGTHLLANHAMLNNIHGNMVAAGLATGDFPTEAEIVDLMTAANAGDAAAFQDLVGAAHWIPAGGNWNELSDAGIETIKKRYGIA